MGKFNGFSILYFSFWIYLFNFLFSFRLSCHAVNNNCNLQSKQLNQFYQMTWSFRIVPCLICSTSRSKRTQNELKKKTTNQLFELCKWAKKSVEELQWKKIVTTVRDSYSIVNGRSVHWHCYITKLVLK